MFPARLLLSPHAGRHTGRILAVHAHVAKHVKNTRVGLHLLILRKGGNGRTVKEQDAFDSEAGRCSSVKGFCFVALIQI